VVIRSTAYICGIYCHSVRTLCGAPTSPRRGLFATSSAIPGIVEGVHHCAAAIPCAPRRYPLSVFEHTYTDARIHVYSDATNLSPLRRSNHRVCGLRLPSIDDLPIHTYTHTHTRVHTCPPPLFQPSTIGENFQAQTPQRRISSSH